MHNLFNFIVKQGAWLLFIVLQLLCMFWIFKDNPYQRSILLSSGNQLTGTIYDFSNSISGYFYLRSENKALSQRNGELEQKIAQLEHALVQQNRITHDSTLWKQNLSAYQTILAEVTNNTVVKANNFITLDKGTKDGIRPGMGIVNQDGVVGIVNMVSENYAVALSMLNSKFRLSCKIKGDEAIGSFIWDGENPEYGVVQELPRHATYQEGDTIVTSGYSSIFPEGVMVGVIHEANKEKKDFNAVRIQLSVDFYRLKNVRIVHFPDVNEQNNLEKQVEKK